MVWTIQNVPLLVDASQKLQSFLDWLSIFRGAIEQTATWILQIMLNGIFQDVQQPQRCKCTRILWKCQIIDRLIIPSFGVGGNFWQVSWTILGKNDSLQLVLAKAKGKSTDLFFNTYFLSSLYKQIFV